MKTSKQFAPVRKIISKIVQEITSLHIFFKKNEDKNKTWFYNRTTVLGKI